MATLALFAVGSAIGGAIGAGAGVAAGTAVALGLTAAQIGGFVGGAIGSFIDSTFLFPALFGQNSLSGPRIGDQSLMSGQEGAPMAWCLGARTRVAGTVIWKSPLIEVKVKTKVGGSTLGGGQSVSNYEYFVDVAVSVCDTTNLPDGAIGRFVKILADGKLIYDGAGDYADKYDGIAVYDGAQLAADPLIESYEGAGNVPAFKDTAYFVINRLRLSHYGNRIPQLQIIVEQANPLSLQETITAIMERAGYETADYNVERLYQCVNGYVVSGPQEMSRVLAPLLLAFNVNVQERDGVIHFIPKGEEDRLLVDRMGHLAATDEGEDGGGRPYDLTDVPGFELPSEVTVEFTDVEADLNSGSRTAKRWEHTPQNRVTLALPLTLTRDEAVKIAKRYLWAAEAERKRVALSLPPRYIALREGMALVLPDVDGREREVWVRRVAIGANYRVEVEGTFYDRDVFEQSASSDGVVIANTNYDPPDTILIMADLPTMTTELEGKTGLYKAMCAEDPEAQWRGGQLWNSPAKDGTYVKLSDVGREATIGYTVDGALRREPRPGRWDTTSRLVVEMRESGLASASDREVLLGANRLGVLNAEGRWEVIAFAVADLIAERTYALSRLLRGVRGTEDAIEGHYDIGRPVVLAEAGPVGFQELNLNSNLWWKAPSLGQAVASAHAAQYLVTGRTIKPFSPCNLRGVFHPTTQALTLSWKRRSKFLRALFSVKTLADDEGPETYEVDIYGTQVLTIKVLEEQTVVYDVTQQTLNGNSGLPVAAAVYQMSTIVGRGNPVFGVFFR